MTQFIYSTFISIFMVGIFHPLFLCSGDSGCAMEAHSSELLHLCFSSGCGVCILWFYYGDVC
jgi:hypothetical protein